jgi:hypothetical protein
MCDTVRASGKVWGTAGTAAPTGEIPDPGVVVRDREAEVTGLTESWDPPFT